MYGLLWYKTIFGWDTTIWKSEIWNIEKIAFKVVQMKFFRVYCYIYIIIYILYTYIVLNIST